MDRVPYVTRAVHDSYPIGSNCLVSRDNDSLTLEFEDGKKVQLEGGYWYAEGLEERRPITGQYDEASIITMMAKDICKEIDEEIFAELDRIAGEVK